MATRNRLVLFAVAVGLLMSVPLAAHHGSAAFDVGKKVTLKGTVKEWAYLNPHCLLTLEVTGDDGKIVQWVVETQAPNVVFPVGYRKDSFKAGDQVTIVVEPVKNGRPIGRILQATLANGKTLGATPAPAAPVG